MDEGTNPSCATIWLLGYDFDDEMLAGLVRAMEGGYTDWVLIPAAKANYRLSTVHPPIGTLVT